MLAPLTTAIIVCLIALSGLAMLATLRGRPVDNTMFYVAAAAEALVVVQLVVGVLKRDQGASSTSAPLFIAYLAGLAVVLPAAFAWSVAERESRWGTGVLLVAALGLLVMVGRLVQIWNGNG